MQISREIALIKRVFFYLIRLSSLPNLTKLPSEFSDDSRMPNRGRIKLLIREITFRLSRTQCIVYVITVTIHQASQTDDIQ